MKDRKDVVLCYIMPGEIESFKKICEMIQKAGFDFKRQALLQITEVKIRKAKNFLKETLKITDYEKRIIVLMLIKENAIKEFKKFIGDEENPDPESIRGIFGFNSIYCSTSNESAKEEGIMFFSRPETIWKKS